MMNPRNFCRLPGFAMLVTISLVGTACPAIGDEIALADCPAAVQKTFEREANGAKLEDIEKETEDGKTIYEAGVTLDEKEYEIVVAEDGTLLEKILEDEEDEDDGDDEEEVEIKLSDCPAAVQKTLKREANRADIDALDKETKDGEAIYEADVKFDGKNYEIRIAEDGILISKALDAEDE